MSNSEHGNRVHIPASQCTGKVRFDSPVIAHRAHRRRGKGRSVYRCPHCGGWHFGGTTGRLAEKR